jgi:uncharacterized membrane protein YdjX (TVP38/TMEM64 family)
MIDASAIRPTGEMQPIAPVTETFPQNEPVAKAPLVRMAVLLVILGCALAAIHFSPLRHLLQDTARIRQAINTLGPPAYPACLLASALLVGCGFPRLILCAVASMVLGFWWGLLLTQGGAILGYYVVFCFIRWTGGEWFIHKRPRLRAIAQTIQGQGIAGVILARQIPLHGTVTNLCLGLSRVKHHHFLIGTAIGLFPEAIPVALVGAGLVKSSLKDSAAILVLAAVAFASLWIGSAYMLRKLRVKRKNNCANQPLS